MTHFIETERCIINIPTLNDVNNYQILHSDSDVMLFLGGKRDRDTTLEWIKQDIVHYNKHGFCLGLVFDKKSNTFIGRAGLVYLNYDDTQRDIEIGYEIKKDCWNQGYATELVLALTHWGFDHLDVTRLVAVTHPENLKSQRVLDKAGMHFKNTIQINSKRLLFYVINREDFIPSDIDGSKHASS